MLRNFSPMTMLGLPQFETRRVLVIINLQNDTFCGAVDLSPSDGFTERTKEFLPYYRKLGDIIWVRTEFEPEKPSASPEPSNPPEKPDAPPESESQEESAAPETGDGDEQRDLIASQSEQETNENSDEPPDSGEPGSGGLSESPPPKPHIYYPSSKSKRTLQRASAESRAEYRDLVARRELEDEDNYDEYLAKPRKGQPPRFYQPGSRGAAFADEFVPFVDESKDVIITKHHYSAFDSTPLLLSLRMKLVTDIYLCGCFSNLSIFSTAADAVRHGFNVFVVEDCMGYVSEEKHVDAMRQMADVMGVAGIDSEEIIAEAGGRAPPDADVVMFTGPGAEGIQIQPPPITAEEISDREKHVLVKDLVSTDLNTLRDSNPEIAPTIENQELLPHADGLRQPTKSVELLFHTLEVADDKLSQNMEKEHQSHEQSGLLKRNLADISIPQSTLSSIQGRQTDSRVQSLKLGPEDSIGEGDSKIIHDALTIPLGSDAFEAVKEEVEWTTMCHRSGEVPRLVAVQGELGEDGSEPLYRHPADESPLLSSFTSTVSKIREELQKVLKQPLNHALIQLYRDGQDNISEHSDKTLDIVRGSSIVNLSLGAQRVMTLRTKKSAHTQPQSPSDSAVPRQTQRVPMPHNSMFVLGQQTNKRWLHGIRADKRPQSQKLDEEKAFDGERISITFRHIGTFTDKASHKIWGQGARSKSKTDAKTVSTDKAETDLMIQAFGRENQQADFDWDKEYGHGFDAINLVSLPTTRLFLCNDEVANLRVRMALSERSLSCEVVRSQQASRSSPIAPRARSSRKSRPVFKDVDEDGSEIYGDLAIFFYLDKYYPLPVPTELTSKQLHRVSTQLFSRTTQSNELLGFWREVMGKPSTDDSQVLAVEDLQSELETWEEYAGEAEFMGGDFYSLIDFAVWPVVHEIVSKWDGWSEKAYPELAAYHSRVGARDSVRKTLLA